MLAQEPQNRAQTHYDEPFSAHISLGLVVLSILLVIGALVAAVIPGGDRAMGIMVILLLALWSLDVLFVLRTSPSVGYFKREIFQLPEGTTHWVYTVRPFLGSRKCEQTGDFHRSRFHGLVVDFNAPFVLYRWFGKDLRVRWQPALFVVDW